MSDTFVVCAVLKDGTLDAARVTAFGQLIASLRNDVETEVVSNEDGVAVLRFRDAALAHDAADVLLGKALAASSNGHPIQPLSLSIDGGTAQSETTVALSALKLAREIGERNQIVIARSAYERLPLLKRDTYKAEEEISTRRVRRRFASGTDSCFVISPIGRDDSLERERANFVFDEYVKRSCAELNLTPFRSDQQYSRTVRRDLMTSVTRAKMVLVYLGKPPWNPNVMIEVGYRMAAGGAIVMFRDSAADSDHDEPLPFDIDDVQVLSLPPKAEEADAARRQAAVTTIAKATTASLTNVPVPQSSRHPFMQIEIDRRGGKHLIRQATREAGDLFAHEGSLVGTKIAEVVTKLQDFMPEGQFQAFAREQDELIRGLTGINDIFAVDQRNVSAMVPMVFERHPIPQYDQKAFLPIIVHSDSSQEDRLILNVLYLDVTSATRIKDGTFRCLLEAEGRSGLIWDNYAVSYDKILTRLSIYREVLRRHIGAMSKDEIHTVLDLGSGTGNATLPLLKAGKHLTVVERSAAMLDLMRRKVLELDDPHLAVFEQSAERLPFANERFDGVTILLALFAMENPRAALSEAIRVLKPGGRLIVTEPKEAFQLRPLLEFAEAELANNGSLEDLAADWCRVRSVNQRIDPGARPKLPVEQIAMALERRGFVEMTREDSHLGNCQTISARKPG